MRSDLVRGLVWFINYAALDPTAVKVQDLDLHGSGMLPDDVEKFSHRWLAFSRSIDIEHDGIGVPVHVVESFFNSSVIAAPAWPINAHAARLDVIGSQRAIDGLRDGSLNSVSLDAYTFNKVVRLPVAQAKAMLGITEKNVVPPTTKEQWALDLAQAGFDGVTAISEISPGVYVAQRTNGLPVAVSFKNGRLEASAAGGAWAHVGVALCESPTLTRFEHTIPMPGSAGPSGGMTSQPIDFAPWDPEKVLDMMASIGVFMDQPVQENFAELTEDLFAFRETSTMKSVKESGYLPHHTVRGGKMMVNKEAVISALSQLDDVPAHGRESARKHLMRHLADFQSGSAIIHGEQPGVRA